MPSLAITNNLPYVQYRASQGATTFTVPFVFFGASLQYLMPLLVYLTPNGQDADDAADILVAPNQYTVFNDPITWKGVVTLNTPANNGDIVTIIRDMDNQRLNYYINGGGLSANALNTDAESQVLFVQQNTYRTHYKTPHYQDCQWVRNPDDTILPILGPNETWVKDPTNSFITTTTVVPVTPPPPTGITWYVVTTPTTMAAFSGYITNNALATVTLTLPTVLTVGDSFEITNSGFGFIIQCAAGQFIRIGNRLTSSGGTVSTLVVGDSIRMVAVSSGTLHILSGVTEDFTYA